MTGEDSEFDQPEEWRDVPGYSCQASTLGRIRTATSVLTLGRYKNGYARVSFRDRGRQKTLCAHILVALAFLGDCPDGLEIDHKDGDRANSAPGNLEYVTHAENMRRAMERRPGYLSGDRNGRARLTEAQAREILATYAPKIGGSRKNPNGIADLARRYGVSKVTICDLVSGRTWTHLRPGPTSDVSIPTTSGVL